MKRHTALQPLSRDHHQALAMALRLRRATADDAPAIREAVLEFWRDHGAIHFRVEEEVLLPAFALHADPDEPCVVRMLVEHVRIRAALRALEQAPEPALGSLHELGGALERHVRLKEREVFPLIEAAMPPDAAQALAATVLAAEAR